MELMGGGCLTEVLEQFEAVQMTEEQIARVAREVYAQFETHLVIAYLPQLSSLTHSLSLSLSLSLSCSLTCRHLLVSSISMLCIVCIVTSRVIIFFLAPMAR
jgi:hypothetical protein